MISNVVAYALDAKAAMPGFKEVAVYVLLPLIAGILAAFKYNYCYAQQLDQHAGHH